MQKLIFHIDVNSAYLSWTAVEMLKNGAALDLRTVPAIIGGDIASRHGVVLAKSIPAKAYGIKTGEPVSFAIKKCPVLLSKPPSHRLYTQYSNKLMAHLGTFCPHIEKVSVDECYMDFTDCLSSSAPVAAATIIKDSVYDTFGYTVNIGISCNKLLAKMASDFQKPNQVHTLFPGEIQTKMWHLPVEALYMVGKAAAKALKKLEINTIGDLAATDLALLTSHLKSHGRLIWEYANGIDDSLVNTQEADLKCIGNSTTLPQDAETAQQAKRILYSLCAQVAERLHDSGQHAKMVSTELKYATFVRVSHQMQLAVPTSDVKALYDAVSQLFDELWNGEPIRLLGVRTAKLSCVAEPVQLNIFDIPRTQKELKAELALEALKLKFGKDVIKKGCN